VTAHRSSIGVRANTFDCYPGEAWLPAMQCAWARLRLTEPCWYAEIALDLSTGQAEFVQRNIFHSLADLLFRWQLGGYGLRTSCRSVVTTHSARVST
jgi:hypothetical protein